MRHTARCNPGDHVSFERGSGKVRAFEGILPNMDRRYRDTESQSVREDLAKLRTEDGMGLQPDEHTQAQRKQVTVDVAQTVATGFTEVHRRRRHHDDAKPAEHQHGSDQHAVARYRQTGLSSR